MKGLAWLCMLVGVAAIGNTIPDEEMPAEVPEAIVEEAQGYRVLEAQEMLRVTAEEGLTVVSSNAYLQMDKENQYIETCIIYAEIRNDTDHTVCLNGSLELKEWLSKPTMWDNAVTHFMPLRIEPGQTAYLNNVNNLWWQRLTEETLDKLRLSITDGPVNEDEVRWYGMPVHVAYQDDSVTIEPEEAPEWATYTEMRRVTFVNRSGDMLPNPAAAVAAYDDQGQLLYVAGSVMTSNVQGYRSYVPDGSPVAILTSIPGAVSQYMEEHGVEVSEYRTVIYGGDTGGAP